MSRDVTDSPQGKLMQRKEARACWIVVAATYGSSGNGREPEAQDPLWNRTRPSSVPLAGKVIRPLPH
jgi:hypothetical protein